MIRSELIALIAEKNPHLSLTDAEKIVSTILDTITDQLVQGGRVELRGFGAFSVRHRDARPGRNPRTGEIVDVTAKAVPFFKVGKGLRDRVRSE